MEIVKKKKVYQASTDVTLFVKSIVTAALHISYLTFAPQMKVK